MYELFSNSHKILQETLRDIDWDGISAIFIECKLLLIELGYPYVNIDLDYLDEIYIHKHDDNIEEIIDNIIIKTYTYEVIDSMMSKWKGYDFLDNRINILEDIIYSYKMEKYNLSIPVIFSQLEGLIAEFTNHESKMNGKQYKDHIQNIISKDKDNPGFSEEITIAYFFNYILQQFAYGEEIPKISRHAILHGADLLNGAKINNLNLIITLDIIMDSMYRIKTTTKI